MHRRALAALLALTWPLAGFAAEPTAPTGVEAELRRLTQELMDAVAPGDREVWRRLLHNELVYVDENGKVSGKESLIAELEPLPAGLVGRIAVDRFQAVLHGDTAIAAGEIQESLDYHGQHLGTRFRFLSTWLRTPGGWRLAGQQVEAVLKDPPTFALPRDVLCAYAGVYELTPAITTTVRCAEGSLTSERTGRPAATYLPELTDLFFVAGQPRTRRIFTRDAGGRVDGFVDRREGEDIRWRRLPGGS